MPNPYFSNLGEFLYVNRTESGRSEGDYSIVKNFFKRAKLRDDIFQDLTFFIFSYLKSNHKYQDVKNAEEIFFRILDDETSNNMPTYIIDEAKKNFNERLKNIDWDNYYSDIPFNPSALSLYKWAPIAEELKTLDRKIVLNSVILKWDIVKKEFAERVKL